MGFWEKVFQVIVEEILKQPYFIVGIMVVIGYIVLRKRWYEVLSGFIRAVVGYMILQVGSGGFAGVATPFIDGLKAMMGKGSSTVLLDTYATQTAIEGYVGNLVSAVYIILLVAFILNILLVALKKWTKLRAIFTTGHVQMQQAFMGFFMIAFAYGFVKPEGISALPAYVFVAVGALLGIYWAVGGNLSLKPTQELTDGAGFAIAHQQMFSIALIDILGTKQLKKGKVPKKLENLKFPGWLNIFNDSLIATTVIMTVFFGTVAVIIAIVNPQVTVSSTKYVETAVTGIFEKVVETKTIGYWQSVTPVLDKISGYQQNTFFYVFKLICQFAVYLAILQLGVRTFVTELTNAFKGISEKLLPNSVPAVDCAVAYGFGSQNAITLGFIAGAVGQVVGTVVIILTNGFGTSVFVITMFVPIFFDNATIGLFANAKLGIKGTIIVPFINGLLQVLLSLLLASWTGITTGVNGAGNGAWMAMNDWLTVWPALMIIVKFIPYVGIFLAVAILLAIPQFQYYFGHKKEDREDYYLMVENWDAYKAKHITPYLEGTSATV